MMAERSDREKRSQVTHFLPFLKWILIINGIEIDPIHRNSLLKYRRFFFIMLFWLRLPLVVAGVLGSTGWGIASMQSALHFVLTIIFHTKMFLNNSKIQSILTWKSVHLKMQDKFYFICTFTFVSISSILSASVFLVFAVDSQAFIERDLFLEENTSFNRIISTGLFVYDTLVYEPLVCSLYIYFIALFHTYRSVMPKISGCYRSASRGCDRTLLEACNSIDLYFTQFDDLFSICPFIWLSVLFVNSVGNITYIINKLFPNSFLIIFNQAYSFININIAVFAISLVTEKLSQHKKHLIMVYTRGILSPRELTNCMCLALSRAFDSKLSVWGMLNITRSLVLSSLGTIVSFSALFIQIIPQMKQELAS